MRTVTEFLSPVLTLTTPCSCSDQPRRSSRVLATLLVFMQLSVVPVQAQPAAGEPATAQAERARIAAERGRIDAAYAAEQQSCFQRFAVNDCRNANRRRRDVEKATLRKRELGLNDAERARKAAVQRDNIEQRRAERAQRAAEFAAQPAPSTSADRPASTRGTPRVPDAARDNGAKPPMAPRAGPRDDRRQRRAAAAAERAERIAQEAANVAQNDRRLRAAAEHKADVNERNQARDKAAAPLPLPTP